MSEDSGLRLRTVLYTSTKIHSIRKGEDDVTYAATLEHWPTRLWMEKDLRISVDPFVKFLIRVRRVIQRQIVRNNKGRLSSSRDDEIAKISIIRLGRHKSTQSHCNVRTRVYLDVALSSTYSETFLEQLALKHVSASNSKWSKQECLPNGKEMYPLFDVGCQRQWFATERGVH